jgi:hypothetical protein
MVYMENSRTPVKALFDELAAERDRWDAAAGLALNWERLDGRALCRISASHPLDIDDEGSRVKAKQWAIDTADKMYATLDKELRARSMALRAAAASSAPVTGDDASDEDEASTQFSDEGTGELGPQRITGSPGWGLT